MPVMPRLKVTNELLTTFVDERTAQGTWSCASVPRLIFADSGFPPGGATFHGGAIGTGLPVQLIFWGTFWMGAEGQTRQQMIIDRTQRLIDSPYFSGLAQYGIAPPTFRGAFTVTSPDAPTSFPANSMKPALELVETLIDDGQLPDPDDGRIAFLLFMPKAFTNSAANGAHSADDTYDFPFDTDAFWVSWTRYFDPSLPGADQDPEATMRTTSHEMVELFTDPEPPTGWYIGGNALKGELADGAFSGATPQPDGYGTGGTRQTAFVNGVMVSSYWSNADNAMIIPIDQDYAGRLTARITQVGQVATSTGTFRPEPTPRMCAQSPACCFEDRDYTWTVYGQEERATISLVVERYRQPSATWTVAGQPVVGATGTLSVSLHGERYNGLDLVGVDQVVSIDYVATATSLTLSPNGPGSQMNFDLDVACSVRDASIVGNLAVDVIATPQITVGFVGSVLEFEGQYTEQFECCLQALTARFKENFEPDWTLPDGGGPIEVDPTVLEALPLWTRIELYERSVQAARVVRLAARELPDDAVLELRDTVLRVHPELTYAREFRRRTGIPGA